MIARRTAYAVAAALSAIALCCIVPVFAQEGSGAADSAQSTAKTDAATPAPTPQASTPSGPSAAEKYSQITAKNIFYPQQEQAAQAGPEAAFPNPQGSGLKLTGVVKCGDKVYAVIQNTGSGESSLLTVGDATGAGQIVRADVSGMTISADSGSYTIPVGFSLAGTKDAQQAQPTEAGAQPAGGRDMPRGGPQPGGDQGGPRGFFRNGGDSTTGDQGGRRFGGRGGFGQDQRQVFESMTPEQREQMMEAMRQRRGGGRSDRREGNQ